MSDDSEFDEFDALYEDTDNPMNVDEGIVRAANSVFNRLFSAGVLREDGSPRGFDLSPEGIEATQQTIAQINDDIRTYLNEAVLIMNNYFFVLHNEGGKSLIGYYRRDAEDDNFSYKLHTQPHKEFIASRENVTVITELALRPRLGTIEVKRKSMGLMWWKSEYRTSYEGITLVPESKERTIMGKLNLWQGFAVKARKGEWGLMQQHIFDVLAAGDDESYKYIIKWMAWAVQNPGSVAETAICFVGDQGTGKSTAGRWLMKMFGGHSGRPTSSRHVTGNFNYQLRDKVFILMDEAVNPDSKMASNIMKGLITDEYLMFEAKGRDAIHAKNRIKMMIISNHEHFLDVGHGDRRYAAFRVSSEKKGDDAYFKKLYAEAAQGGVEAMLYDLLDMDLGGWHPRADIPETVERRRQKVWSLENQEALMMQLLEEGTLPEGAVQIPDGVKYGGWPFVPTHSLIEHGRRTIGRTFTPHAITKLLKQLGCKKHQYRTSWGHVFPPVKEMREAWEKLGQPSDFSEEYDEWGYPPPKAF